MAKIGNLLLLLFWLNVLMAQDDQLAKGRFSVGGRSSLSLFNDHSDEGIGRGLGGQFRLQLAERVNTEWFADYFTSALGDFANRTDYHIGWSVKYYLNSNNFTGFQPYILAGHCFDFTRIAANSSFGQRQERWSSAVQGGLGGMYHFTPRFNVSLTAQYMAHLGKHLHAHQDALGNVDIHLESRNGLEGHLLVHLGFTYVLFRAWGK